METINLYYAPRTRSTRPRWLLEELGLPYQLKRIDLSKGEHKQRDYLEVHPLGLVPAMEIEGKKMFESAAMVMYLADKYNADKKLAPKFDSNERSDYLQWFFFFQNHIETSLVTYFEHTHLFAAEKRKPELAKMALEKFSPAAKIVNDHLKKHSYMLAQFSALDCFAGSMVIWANAMQLLSDFPQMEAYAERLKEREAWKKANEN